MGLSSREGLYALSETMTPFVAIPPPRHRLASIKKIYSNARLQTLCLRQLGGKRRNVNAGTLMEIFSRFQVYHACRYACTRVDLRMR